MYACAVRSYLRLTYLCITQLKAQGPRTCNENKEEEEACAVQEMREEGQRCDVTGSLAPRKTPSTSDPGPPAPWRGVQCHRCALPRIDSPPHVGFPGLLLERPSNEDKDGWEWWVKNREGGPWCPRGRSSCRVRPCCCSTPGPCLQVVQTCGEQVGSSPLSSSVRTLKIPLEHARRTTPNGWCSRGIEWHARCTA